MLIGEVDSQQLLEISLVLQRLKLNWSPKSLETALQKVEHLRFHQAVHNNDRELALVIVVEHFAGSETTWFLVDQSPESRGNLRLEPFKRHVDINRWRLLKSREERQRCVVQRWTRLNPRQQVGSQRW